MALQVIGAGLGRTGTYSLKLALERLLDGKCYHMAEVFENPGHVPEWQAAADGNMPDWEKLFTGYKAAVDWPVSAYYYEIANTFPDALVVHSLRDPEAWWASASSTIFFGLDRPFPPEMQPWRDMVGTMMLNRFTPNLGDKEACLAEFNKHNEAVPTKIPSNRLLTWRASDGWEPLCAALNVPVPHEPFPKANTKEEFLARFGASKPDA